MKNLGPANDDIPQEEMLLAEMLQNVKARGIRATRGAYFTYKKYITGRVASNICAACAVGAYALGPPGQEIPDGCTAPMYGVEAGNDDAYWGKDPGGKEDYNKGYELGAAYQSAMEES